MKKLRKILRQRGDRARTIGEHFNGARKPANLQDRPEFLADRPKKENK